MIFRYPLFRNGFYYMSKRTFHQLKGDEDAKDFDKLLKKSGVVVTELQDYFLITISNDQIQNL